MCSTPFGIIGIHTNEKASSSGISIGAQRLSASLEFTRSELISGILFFLCAQRLSASLEFTPFDLATAHHPFAVLNAFRHHWNSHMRSATTGRRKAMCSTPFGIIGIHTATWPAKATRTRWPCSTPFGIIGIHTRKAGAVWRTAHGRVLNAFRHHWNSHSLQAFSFHPSSSAQRLSASLEFTPRIDAIAVSLFSVLNAFRHHWNSHKEQYKAQRAYRRCSTPFGIIGIHT